MEDIGVIFYDLYYFKPSKNVKMGIKCSIIALHSSEKEALSHLQTLPHENHSKESANTFKSSSKRFEFYPKSFFCF